MSLNELVTPTNPITIVTSTTFEQYSVGVMTADLTLSAANILGGLVYKSASGNITATTSTAALLLAALPTAHQRIGAGCVLNVSNASTGTITLAAGTGVDISRVAVNPIAANTSRTLIFICTNATTPAFFVYG